MTTIRTIKKTLKSRLTTEGAGVRLKRAFGFDHTPQLDPFLLLDDFHSDNPDDYVAGFPWHPHRGMETITYLLEGKVLHEDSLGHKGEIAPGGVQWMTAGSGIIHQEMPEGDKNGVLWGLQLWSNLPASHKMMGPRYQEIKSSEIPEVWLDHGVKFRVICGEVNKIRGPVKDIVSNPDYLDITVPFHTNFTHHVHKGHTVFAYVLSGKGFFGPQEEPFKHNEEQAIRRETLVIFEDGDSVSVSTDDENIRFLLISGKPIKEPVAWYGPIVMNTQEELRTAFEEYENGTFLKHTAPPKVPLPAGGDFK
jgi:redox-sensitive bicupin YhaK (pirin superfamily)